MSLWFPTQHDARADFTFLEGRSAPRDRPLMAITDKRSTTLRWREWPRDSNRLELSLAVAIDFPDSPENELLVTCGPDQGVVGQLEIRHPDPYQILSIPLDPARLSGSVDLTLRLQLASGSCIWLFAPNREASHGLEYHVPHLHVPSGPPAEFRSRLCSMASLQAFGWKEGCVLEGIHALGKAGLCLEAPLVIRRHLDEFGFSSGKLIYETPRSERVSNRLTTIESTLPFAQVARLDPLHPWVDLAVDYWQQQLDELGQVCEHSMISSEGAYTVAYPMTLIAHTRGEERWAVLAQDLLIKTFAHLVQPEGIYLRCFQDGTRTHRNWARGLAWLLLGHVQTLRHQPSPSAQLVEQLLHLAEFAKCYQREDGLWSTYLDEPTIKPDTSGSAGIAAAFALASGSGWLPTVYRERAMLCRQALSGWLTSEGFLGGCSQSNKGGEELQRSPYRVALPYALGLLGTLEAALMIPENRS